MSATGFDKVLDEKIGFGNYQRLTYTLIGLLALSGEALIVSLSIIIPVLKNEWNLSEEQEEFIESIFFIGVFLGSLVVGMVCDRIGRRRTLILSSLFQFIFGLLCTVATGYSLALVSRAFVGMSIGSSFPILPVIVTEVSPKSYRGKAQVFLQFLLVVGAIFAIGLSKLFIADLITGNWRIVVFLSSLPALVVTLGALFSLYESARFLIARGNVQQGMDILKTMGIKNKGSVFFNLAPEDIEEINSWYKKVFA